MFRGGRKGWGGEHNNDETGNGIPVIDYWYRGVIANILSLVYRVLEYEDTADGSWNLYALLTCTYVPKDPD